MNILENCACESLTPLIALVTLILSLLYAYMEKRKTKALNDRVVKTAVVSDIRALTQTLYETGLINNFIHASQGIRMPSFATSTERSDYFQLFGSIAPNIGTLPIEWASEAVAFYTFLKVSRDAAVRLAAVSASNLPIEPAELDYFCRHFAKSVLLALLHCLDSARFVLSASGDLDRRDRHASQPRYDAENEIVRQQTDAWRIKIQDAIAHADEYLVRGFPKPDRQPA